MGWFTFELSSKANLDDTLDALDDPGSAFDAASSAKKTRSQLK